jgi:molecular chaperone HtpG
MENLEKFIPEYLNFLKEIVDLDDLTLTISREQLQQNQIIKMIMKNITKKRPELFNIIAEKKEDFNILYEQFKKTSNVIFIKIFFKTNKTILT